MTGVEFQRLWIRLGDVDTHGDSICESGQCGPGLRVWPQHDSGERLNMTQHDLRLNMTQHDSGQRLNMTQHDLRLNMTQATGCDEKYFLDPDVLER